MHVANNNVRAGVSGWQSFNAPRIPKGFIVLLTIAALALKVVLQLSYFVRCALYCLLLLCGDIHTNPGPRDNRSLKFFHWNLNSLSARGRIKIPLIETYDSLYKYDIITISETMLDHSVSNNEISIDGFSKEIYRSDHPSNTKIGGVFLYFREGLPIKRRTDLELLPEMILCEITIARKKILFGTLYRTPSQNSQQFETFIDRLQEAIDKMKAENPHSIILTGDFNCRSNIWWTGDIEQPEGTALEELIETNGLYQLIEEPTNIRNERSSCIDLIVTDQPNFFVASGVHPSLDEHCQHQIIYGKLNVSLLSPPPYRRAIYDYSKADVHVIRESISSADWASLFYGLSPTEMVDKFTNVLSELFTRHIPNRVVKFDDRDPPWMKQELKTAIKRKHRVYAKFVKRGRKVEAWNHVKHLQNETTKMIIHAKNEYHLNLGRRLSNNLKGPKTYWSILNRLVSKKNVTNIPPLLENGKFLTNVEAKANVFNEYFVAKCREMETGSTIPTFIPRFQMPL